MPATARASRVHSSTRGAGKDDLVGRKTVASALSPTAKIEKLRVISTPTQIEQSQGHRTFIKNML